MSFFFQGVNPCAYTTCPANTTCKVGPGEKVRCESPCDTVRCRENTHCVAIFVNCLAGSTDCTPGLRAKCVPNNSYYDPCEEYSCPKGEGCYTDPKTKQPFCEDPCVHGKIQCKNGQVCYAEEVTCIKAPCNPIPVCKDPCATINCVNKPGYKCIFLRIGIPCQKPICRPQPLCVPKNSTTNT